MRVLVTTEVALKLQNISYAIVKLFSTKNLNSSKGGKLMLSNIQDLDPGKPINFARSPESQVSNRLELPTKDLLGYRTQKRKVIFATLYDLQSTYNLSAY